MVEFEHRRSIFLFIEDENTAIFDLTFSTEINEAKFKILTKCLVYFVKEHPS